MPSVLIVKSLLFAGMAFARVIVLNIRKSMASVAQPALRGSRDWAYSVQKWNAHPDIRTSNLLPISSRFSPALGWALKCSFYTAPPDFAKRKSFKHAFANKQCLEDFVGDLRVTFSI
jgi:hypothetical protein